MTSLIGHSYHDSDASIVYGLHSNAQAGSSSIPTRQAARFINGIHTEVFAQAYADRVFILVTQLGRIGSLVSRH